MLIFRQQTTKAPQGFIIPRLVELYNNSKFSIGTNSFFYILNRNRLMKPPRPSVFALFALRKHIHAPNFSSVIYVKLRKFPSRFLKFPIFPSFSEQLFFCNNFGRLLLLVQVSRYQSVIRRSSPNCGFYINSLSVTFVVTQEPNTILGQRQRQCHQLNHLNQLHQLSHGTNL